MLFAADSLKTCKQNWAAISKHGDANEISKCLFELLMSITPRLKEASGIAALGVPQLDPLSIPGVLVIGDPKGLFSANLTEAIVNGITKGLIPQQASLRYDPVKKEATLVVRVPVDVGVVAKFSIEINPGRLFGQEGAGSFVSGDVTGKTGNVITTLVIGMATSKNGELRTRTSSSVIDAAYFKLNFKSDKPDDPLETTINSVTGGQEASLVILEQLKPHVNKILARSLGALFHRGWKVLDRI